jgi:hypothetical protein
MGNILDPFCPDIHWRERTSQHEKSKYAPYIDFHDPPPPWIGGGPEDVFGGCPALFPFGRPFEEGPGTLAGSGFRGF